MSHHPLFLDSNIYLGYALDGYLEPFHEECQHVFAEMKNGRHTSETVEGELKRKTETRTSIYLAFVRYWEEKNSPFNFDVSEMSDSDADHMRKLLKGIAAGSYSLEFVRGLGRLLIAGVRDAMNRTDKPLIPRSRDPDLVDNLIMIAIHRSDAQVLSDFFSWGLTIQGAHFITGDGEITGNRAKIFEVIEDSKTQHCGHLSIVHVKDVSKKIG